MRRARVTGAIVAVLVLLPIASSCDDASSGSAGTGTTAPANDAKADSHGTATITSLEVPTSINCVAGELSADLTVSYAVAGSVRQVVRIDGLAAEGTEAPSGSVTVGVRCDPLPHDVVLIAFDGDGNRTTEVRSVATVAN